MRLHVYNPSRTRVRIAHPMVSEGGAWMVSEDEDLVVFPLTLIFRGFHHAPGGAVYHSMTSGQKRQIG